jgi:hypothetical protein
MGRADKSYSVDLDEQLRVRGIVLPGAVLRKVFLEPAPAISWTANFGTFLLLGYFAKVALDRLMERSGAELSDVQAQAGANRRPRKVFLLGA